MARTLPYNAKTLPFDRPGAGAFNYGVNQGNVGKKLERIWLDRDTVDGGSRAIFNKISNWASPEQVTRRGGNPNDTQWRLWQNYIRTGKVDPNLRTSLAVRGLDLGLRETARAQQHKDLWANSFLGKLTGVALQAGGYALGGPWGAAAAGALYGGTVGGDGWRDALMGGIQGYTMGSGLQGLNNAAGATGGWLSSFKNPGTFIHNLWNGGPGALTSGSQIPNGISTGARAAGAFGGSTAGAGGGSMGVFSDILGTGRDVLNWGNYGGGNIFGDIVRGGLNYWGQQNASDNLNDAANRAFENSRFIPYNVNTPGGSATFDGNNINTQLSPQAQAVANQYRGLVNTNLGAYNKFNPNNYSQNMYRTLSNLRAPAQTAENNNLLSNTYNLGRWGSTVGAQDIYSADMAQNLQDQALRLQSQQAGAQESDRLFNNYMKSAAAYNTLLNSPSDLARLGLAGGSVQSGANANAMQYPWLAAGADYGSTNAFWSTLANSAGNMISNTGNSINNGYTFRSNYQSQYNPDTGYFVDYPRFNNGK